MHAPATTPPAALPERLGVFARSFAVAGPTTVLERISAVGYAVTHWNCSVMGRSPLGEDVSAEELARVRAEAHRLGIRIPSLSATANLAHPDPARRRAETTAAARLIGLAPALGVDLVTLCSGSRDPDDRWRHHPGNDLPDAWDDLRTSLDPLLEAADRAGVRLGVEPEPGNVVCDAEAADRLLVALGADAPIGIVFDAANLVSAVVPARRDPVLRDAAAALGPRVLSAHVKGIGRDADAVLSVTEHVAVLERLPAVPVIVQDVPEAEVSAVRSLLVAAAGGARR